MKPLVYVAGPYTQGDVAVNINKIIAVADVLQYHGYLPFVPHLTHFWHLVSPKPKDFWMELDKRILSHCNAIIRLPGNSTGADEEVALARSIGIPIFFSLDELVKNLPRNI